MNGFQSEKMRKFFGTQFKKILAEKGISQQRFINLYNTLPNQHVNKNSVSDWTRGVSYPTPEKMECICKILDVEESYFQPTSLRERYWFSQEGVDEDARKKSEYADLIGLNENFLIGLREIVDFDKYYRVYTPLQVEGFFSSERYIRIPEDRCADIEKATSNGQIYQVCRNGKRIQLRKEDLEFLKDLQDEVSQYVEYLLYKRIQDMQKELEDLERDSMGKSGVFTVFSDEKIGTYDKYHSKVLKRAKNGKEG